MSKPIFYQGQQVGCLMYGEGVIFCVNDETEILSVDFAENRHYFLPNGAWMKNARPTLYPIDQYKSIIANLPAPEPEPWKPKPGEWCWFWDKGENCISVVSRFKSYDANKNYPYMTSTGAVYKNCAPFPGEMPPHLKEVQP